MQELAAVTKIKKKAAVLFESVGIGMRSRDASLLSLVWIPS